MNNFTRHIKIRFLSYNLCLSQTRHFKNKHTTPRSISPKSEIIYLFELQVQKEDILNMIALCRLVHKIGLRIDEIGIHKRIAIPLCPSSNVTRLCAFALHFLEHGHQI